MDFKYHFIVWCTLLCCSVNADDFIPTMMMSSTEVYAIRHDMNASIGTITFTAVSMLHCSALCSKHLSTSVYFDKAGKTCQCNNDIDVATEDDQEKPGIIYGQIGRIVQISKNREFTKWSTFPLEPSCLALHSGGFSTDGVYTIQPTGQAPVDTWCDMQNGGWTVLQRRLDGSENFNRGWSDYVSGFGNKTGEYWLGLNNIHALTLQASELHIYVEAFEGMSPQSGNAHYTTVTVYGPTENYRLNVGGFTGTCYDPFSGTKPWAPNNAQFSTYDRDNDSNERENCATSPRGGWWFAICFDMNLNGYYYGGFHDSREDGINWISCWNRFYSLKNSVMKVREK